MIERLRDLATALETALKNTIWIPVDEDNLLDLLKWILLAHPDPEVGKFAANDLDLLWRELFPERYSDDATHD